MNTVIMILVALLIFDLVILIHEFGHFMVAKKAGIKVNEFAIGMGPTLFKIQKGETKYAIRAFPIGGFVSMEGEDEESSDERSFTRAPIYKRMLVIIFGALMNIVLGFLAVLLLVGAGSSSIPSRTVNQVAEGSLFMPGDEIISVNGRKCFTQSDITYELIRLENGSASFVVIRDGEKLKFNNVNFELVETLDDAGEPYEYIDIGFSLHYFDKTFGNVIKESFLTTGSYARIIYRSLGDLITGRESVNNLSGPVGIVNEIGKAINLGWAQVVNLLAIISINLGIINMLPFPALDGGKAILLIIEAIRRKPLKQKYEIALNLIGFAILIALMLFVSFNDIRKLISF